MRLFFLTFALPLSITAIVCLAGCGQLASHPANSLPLVGPPCLAEDYPAVRPTYDVLLLTSNPGPGELVVQVHVTGRQGEFLNSITGFTVSEGGGGNFVVCEVKRKRLHPVHLSVIWTRGQSSGTQNYVIGPKRTDSNNPNSPNSR